MVAWCGVGLSLMAMVLFSHGDGLVDGSFIMVDGFVDGFRV